jgi:hypothetical protein
MTFHKYLGDSKMFEYDKHYQECRQQNKPFIKAKINPVHGNYYINVDLMTCNYIFTKKEQDEIEKLIQSEKTFVNLNGLNSFNDYSINEEVVWIDGVSADHVDTICTLLFDLTQKYHD